MNRRAHFLSGNKGTELPNVAVWVDTETHERRLNKTTISHHLSFGIAWFSRTRALDDWLTPLEIRFVKPGQFWDWLEARLRSRVRLYLFAHNWAFDGPVLHMFDELPARGWKLTKAIIESPPIILRWRKAANTILCLDTLNWWRMPLAKVGESLGLAKLEMPGKRAKQEVWDEYCRRDVEITYRVVREWWRFIRDHDLGSFGPTLASQSIRAFRHRFMEHPILIDNNPKALALARDSLHGGRVECFRIGKQKGPINVYDVNSMYPFVMQDSLFPAKLLLHTTKVSISDLSKWLKTRCVIARVRIQTKENRYATVRDGRLVFPIGRFIESLTTCDLQPAISNGNIHSIIEAAVYEAAPIFQKFVSEIYALRMDAIKRGDTVRSWLLKILMNSLYGKFAQRGMVWDTVSAADDNAVKTWEEFDYDSGILKRFRSFAGILQSFQRTAEAFDSSPAIASHVTAYARQYLYRLMALAGMSRVLYVDTDSLFLRAMPRDPLARLIDPLALGGLKLEKTLDWLILRGPKDYQTPDKEVIKGVRGSAVWTDDKTLTQDQWASLTGLVALGDLSAPITKKISKTLARTYTKGTVTHDGRVLPFVLREW